MAKANKQDRIQDFATAVAFCTYSRLLRPFARKGVPFLACFIVEDTDQFGFHETALELLLKHVEATHLIITGMATNICVLFTANDAYLRGFQLYVPRDCVAANSAQLTRIALTRMKDTLKASTAKSDSLDWAK